MPSDLASQLQAALGGAYTIERELGGGGMSRVFVATEVALGRKVVVKVLSQELAGGLSAERFKREIQLAASLQHPNIVPLLAAGDADGVPYYTMPFVQGESLRAKLQHGGELPVRNAVAIMRDVARALDYAHAHGVVHRDIKPDNVLLSADYAVVTDFGVGKALLAARTGAETLTQLGVAIGTPAYMSPEQVAGDVVDHRADFYAYGCMAYEMLTGAPPFRDTSAVALFAAHATRTPVALSDVRPATPAALAALVMLCLEKRPADRPQTAREIIAALDTASITSSITAIHVPIRRRRLPLAIGAAAALILAAIVAYATLGGPRTTPRDTVVAVTPFRVSGADPSLRTLREGMLDLVSAKLSGTTHAVDPRTVLSAWRKQGGSDATDLPQDRALALATRLGAGRLLQGELVGTPQRMVITASLVSAPEGRAHATASATGEQSQLALLVDSLMAELFVQEAGGSAAQARRLAGTPFGALQAYLEGQSHYRQGRYVDAEAAFNRALDVDSNFALAGIQLQLASAWTASGRGGRGTRAALRAYQTLTPRERVLVVGVDPGIVQGRASEMREQLDSAERNVTLFPDILEVWYFLGDNLFHTGWVTTGGDDPWRRAIAAFERALALDSTFAPAREHLPFLYFHFGDSAKARAVLASMASDSADYFVLNRMWLGLMPDSTERRRTIDSLIARSADLGRWTVVGAIYGAQYLSEAGRTLEKLKARAATDAERRLLASTEVRLALNRGQPRRAAAAERVARATDAAIILAAVFWDGDSAAAADAFNSALKSLDRPIPSDTSLGTWTDNVYTVAVAELARGDTTHARRAIGLLRSVPAPPAQSWRNARPHNLALILDAQFAARAKRMDAAIALLRADSMLARGPSGNWALSTGALVAARLWQERGDLPRAYAAIKRVYYTTTSPSFYSTYHLERARIAAALGETRDAIEEYTMYLNLRDEPEPLLRPQVDAVRKELERVQQKAR